MSIKEEIQKLINSYKKEFLEKTGIQLLAYPAIKLEKKPLEMLIKIAEEQCGIDDIKEKNRSVEYVQARRLVCKVAHEMEYSDREVAMRLKLDRSTIIHYRMTIRLQESTYAKYIETIMATKMN